MSFQDILGPYIAEYLDLGGQLVESGVWEVMLYAIGRGCSSRSFDEYCAKRG